MCPHEEKLTAWLLGDLPPEEHQAVTRHLETCDACRSVSEELSRVLTPLRSGLEKDRKLHFADQSAAASPFQAFRAFWTTPQAGLKRVAALTLFLSCAAALIALVCQKPLPTAPAGSGKVTYVSYLQPSSPPPPALRSEKAVQDEGLKAPALAETDEPAAAPAPSVEVQSVPAREHPLPLPKPIIVDESVRQATQHLFDATKRKAIAAAAATPAPPAMDKDKAAPKQREKAAIAALDDTLAAKPIRLAGAGLAATNAPSTNAAPTNAVQPAVKRTP